MQVVFDAYWWMRGPQSNRGVLRDIVSTWLEEFPQDEVTLAVPHADVDAVRAEVGLEIGIIPLRAWPHGVAIAFELPLRARRRKAIVLSHNFTPWRGRSVVLIQDLLFVAHPEWFTRAERAYFALMPRTAPRARVVLATTRDQARMIKAAVPRAREVRAVGLGLSRDLLGAIPTRPDFPLQPGGFVLAVGRLNVRKNLARSVLAAVRSERLSAARPLVVVGAAQGRTDEFSEEIRLAIGDGRVLLAGHLETDELAWLYENAGLFLFVSLGEGFGLPPVEAHAFGARVIASDIPVMHEVLGDDAEFVDPLDVDAIEQSIRAADIGLDAPAVRLERAARARQANSWVATVSAIRSAMAGAA